MNILQIDENLRLYSPKKEDWNIALKWYSNPDILYFSEGIPYDNNKTYDMNIITNMYTYLSKIGMLFFIQIKENDQWISIGDATCAKDNMPIMISDKKYWGLGIGKKVLTKLIEIAKENDIHKVNVEIYKYNERSHRLYTSLGFVKISEDEKSNYYELNI